MTGKRAGDGESKTVEWVHTGITGPYLLGVRDYIEAELGSGVAYSATLVHPDLGAVGLISNHGRGGQTLIDFHDRTRFGYHDLEAFVAQATQDGKPMAAGFEPVQRLLDEAISETQYTEDIADTRARNEFAVRAFQPPGTTGSHGYRGYVTAHERIVLDRRSRPGMVDGKTMDVLSQDGADPYWEMWNGERWSPLLSDPPIVDRREELIALYDTGRPGNTGHIPDAVSGRPLSAGLYLVGAPEHGAFTLTGDTKGRPRTDQWCPCGLDRPRRVRFEKWSLEHGLVGAGTIHAAKSCRRLLTIE